MDKRQIRCSELDNSFPSSNFRTFYNPDDFTDKLCTMFQNSLPIENEPKSHALQSNYQMKTIKQHKRNAYP